MALIGLVELRRVLDKAITYGDEGLAKKLVARGLKTAQDKGMPGEIMYFKAQREIIEENWRDAMVYLDLAIKENPKDGAAYNDRALCMTELGILAGVFSYLDKGIEAEPDYATIYHNKGWLLNQLGRPSEALPLFKKALELEPERPVTFENMGHALANLGQKEQAVKCYKIALGQLGRRYNNIKRQIRARIKDIEAA